MKNQTAVLHAKNSRQSAQVVRRSVRVIIKYAVVAAVGVLLYMLASDYAFAQRGYKAVGSEAVFILLPLIYYIGLALVRDALGAVVASVIKTRSTELRKTRLEGQARHK